MTNLKDKLTETVNSALDILLADANKGTEATLVGEGESRWYLKLRLIDYRAGDGCIGVALYGPGAMSRAPKEGPEDKEIYILRMERKREAWVKQCVATVLSDLEKTNNEKTATFDSGYLLTSIFV